jgi:CBS domain-containing protein
MRVADIMSRPVTVASDASVRDVAHALLRHNASAAIVVGADGAPRGIITERDFAEHGELPYSERGTPTVLRVPLVAKDASVALADARTARAHRLMRPLDAVLHPDEPVERALDLMLHRGKRNVVVVQGDRAVGVVSCMDFVRLAAGEPTERAPALELV